MDKNALRKLLLDAVQEGIEWYKKENPSDEELPDILDEYTERILEMAGENDRREYA